MLLEVHMDDIHTCGPTLALTKIGEMIKARLSVKHANIFEYGSKARYQHLRRERIMDEAGCYIKPNPKYVEAAAELLGLVDSEPVSTPLAAGDRADSELESPKLDGEQHGMYRRVVGALLYLTHDRGDAAYAVRLLAKDARRTWTVGDARSGWRVTFITCETLRRSTLTEKDTR